ncbi:nucleotide sugar dehydrogenase, partial [Francisella tularensis subsp. holarctica]|nr:nucleotide sugar dehydrogenase [Francisella tularensis subsp. holarctica]
PTKEVGDEAVRNTTMKFSCDETSLIECKFHIVAVPTPVKADKTPDLTPIIKSSETVGRNLVNGDYVVFESTVYPGVKEDVFVPILEKESGLRS